MEKENHKFNVARSWVVADMEGRKRIKNSIIIHFFKIKNQSAKSNNYERNIQLETGIYFSNDESDRSSLFELRWKIRKQFGERS